MSRRSRWMSGLAAAVVVFVAGWVVPNAVTTDASRDVEDDPIVMAETFLGSPLRALLTVGYDVEEIPREEQTCRNDRYRVTARSWWFVPLTTYEVGCGPAEVVAGL